MNTPAVVMRPMLLPMPSVNQRLPSEASRDRVGNGTGRWMPETPSPTSWRDAPDVANRLRKPQIAVRARRDPLGTRVGGREGNSVTMPAGVMRPILLPSPSVNHRLPSGPAVISLT